MDCGRLVYVVGASGAGKDSVIRYAREALGEQHRVVFAHRYITRPVDARGENHIALSKAEFLLRKRHGLFAMDWQSHGFHYGIGVEVDAWLSQALTVVVNGSRAYLPVARARYPALELVWITAGPEELTARLLRRGRESGAQIAARVDRNRDFATAPAAEAVHIENDGALEHAGSRFVALLKTPFI
jgi:ribose 1,5-bisphosphokinase